MAHSHTRPAAPVACSGPKTAPESNSRLETAMLPGVSLHADDSTAIAMLGYSCNGAQEGLPEEGIVQLGVGGRNGPTNLK